MTERNGYDRRRKTAAYWQVCPKCRGQKQVAIPPWVAGDVPTFATSGSGPWPCGVCDAKGIIPIPVQETP